MGNEKDIWLSGASAIGLLPACCTESRAAANAGTHAERLAHRFCIRWRTLERQPGRRRGTATHEWPGTEVKSALLARWQVDRIHSAVWRQPRCICNARRRWGAAPVDL